MEAGIQLEPARPGDARPIALMSRDLIEHGLPWRWQPNSVLSLVRDLDTAVVVARKRRPIDHQICGFAIMGFDWKRSKSHLILLAVEEARQRQGVGRALVRWLEVVARRGGLDRVELEVRAESHAAQRFYRSLGYREAGRIAGYYQGREDAVKMMSPLRAPASAR